MNKWNKCNKCNKCDREITGILEELGAEDIYCSDCINELNQQIVDLMEALDRAEVDTGIDYKKVEEKEIKENKEFLKPYPKRKRKK